LASPLTYDSFIHYNLPVYPGALRQSYGGWVYDEHAKFLLILNPNG
jgi:hypothetical protein